MRGQKIGVMFPGQGAQRPCLGEQWRDHPAWSVVERAEAVLGRPVSDLLLDPAAALDRTDNAQLTVLLSSLMAWEAVAPTLDVPVGFAGHSLGQITALITSGSLGFEDGIRLADARARHTQEAAERRPGAMAALLGATVEQAQECCDAAGGECWVANENAPGQVVIAGTPAGVDAALDGAGAIGVRRTSKLPVGGAFHTPLMGDAKAAFEVDLKSVVFSDPAAPVVSNGDGQPVTDGEDWPVRLADHLVRPVRWSQSVATLVALGASELVEVGPGTTLAGLARRIAPETAVRSIEFVPTKSEVFS
ncbi:MAG TPA: ACP S-malonyltransferase [Acidimicrobiales bacterium]|nr:ACP S-malonyltransferase [Acidimicrobiales bacterium]